MSKQDAIKQLAACESVLRSNAGTDAIVFAVLGKQAALRTLGGAK